MQAVYTKAAVTHPALKQCMGNAQRLDSLFPAACDVRVDEIQGRGFYYWLVWQPDAASPYRVALAPDFTEDGRNIITVYVYKNVSSDEVIEEFQEEAAMGPSIFLPIIYRVKSLDTLLLRLQELTEGGATQPSIKSLGQRIPEQCAHCCVACVLFVYMLSRLGIQSKCVCCCGGCKRTEIVDDE